MTVIAFHPRLSRGPQESHPKHPGITGTFRSPRGGSGQMQGLLRVQRLVVAPRGAFVTGVFTGELRDAQGHLVGLDSRRTTQPADLVRVDDGFIPIVRPFRLDLMGIPVDIDAIRLDPAHALAVVRLTSAVGDRRLGFGRHTGSEPTVRS